MAWSVDDGNLWQLANRNSMSGTHGLGPGAPICQGEQSEGAGTPRPRHPN